MHNLTVKKLSPAFLFYIFNIINYKVITSLMFKSPLDAFESLIHITTMYNTMWDQTLCREKQLCQTQAKLRESKYQVSKKY